MFIVLFYFSTFFALCISHLHFPSGAFVGSIFRCAYQAPQPSSIPPTPNSIQHPASRIPQPGEGGYIVSDMWRSRGDAGSRVDRELFRERICAEFEWIRFSENRIFFFFWRFFCSHFILRFAREMFLAEQLLSMKIENETEIGILHEYYEFVVHYIQTIYICKYNDHFARIRRRFLPKDSNIYFVIIRVKYHYSESGISIKY